MDLDIDTAENIYVWCPKCGECSLQKKGEYPLICCNQPGLTFGNTMCCRCFTTLNPETIEEIDLCITCRFTRMELV